MELKHRKMTGLEATALFFIFILSMWLMYIFAVLTYIAPTLGWKIATALGFTLSMFLNRWGYKKELEFN